MAITVQGGNQTATRREIRHGLETRMFFKKHRGLYLDATTPVFGVVHTCSDVTNLPEITAELENQRDHFELGYDIVTIDDGKTWTVEPEIEGNALELVASLVGQDLHTATDIEYGKDYGVQGDIILLSRDRDDKTVVVCDYILDVGVRLLTIPGGGNEERTTTVQLYSKHGRGGRIANGDFIGHEIFYSNGGTIVNAAAPDGATAAFTVGHGNGSYAVAAPPTLKTVRPNLATTNPYHHFYYIRVNGSDVPLSDVASWVPGTGVLTFTYNLPAQAYLEWAFLVDGSATGLLGTPPHFHSGSNMMVDWKTHQLAV